MLIFQGNIFFGRGFESPSAAQFVLPHGDEECGGIVAIVGLTPDQSEVTK